MTRLRPRWLSLLLLSVWDWFPWQPCRGCNRWYWGGLPSWSLERERFDPSRLMPVLQRVPWWRARIFVQWKAGWKEYCSRECYDECESMYIPEVTGAPGGPA